MKTIDSLGGSFLLIERNIAESWAGCDGVSFFPIECGPSDYECLEAYFSQRRHVITITGLSHNAIILELPYETALVAETSEEVIFAQVYYAGPTWNFEQVVGRDFSHLSYEKPVIANCVQSEYVLFDSVRAWGEVGSELLSCKLPPGKVECAGAEMIIDDETSLVIYRIRKSAQP